MDGEKSTTGPPNAAGRTGKLTGLATGRGELDADEWPTWGLDADTLESATLGAMCWTGPPETEGLDAAELATREELAPEVMDGP
jgi:hypothetical protein